MAFGETATTGCDGREWFDGKPGNVGEVELCEIRTDGADKIQNRRA